VPDLTFQADEPPSTDDITEDFANPPTSGDDDRYFDLQWGHAAIDAAGAWNAGYRGAGVRVAVLDSGVFCQHADIVPNLIAAESTSFVPGETYCNTVSTNSTHGTHTSGTILAADNGIGTIGVAPEAKLIAVKVLSAATGSGSFQGIINGIVYAADHGADVINMSLGVRGGLDVGGKDTAELINATKRAVYYARSQNAITVVSAGNDGRDLDHDSGVTICDTEGCYQQLRPVSDQLRRTGRRRSLSRQRELRRPRRGPGVLGVRPGVQHDACHGYHQLLQLDGRHQHGRAARVGRRRAHHRQARR
jgi:subtilisin family serine protease